MNQTEIVHDSIDSKLNFESIFYNAAYFLFVTYVILRKDWIFCIGVVATLIMTVTHILVIREYRQLPPNDRQSLRKKIRNNTIFTAFELLVYIGNFIFLL